MVLEFEVLKLLKKLLETFRILFLEIWKTFVNLKMFGYLTFFILSCFITKPKSNITAFYN
jgi:hypothetical protein